MRSADQRQGNIVVAAILRIHGISECRSYVSNGVDAGFVPESAARSAPRESEVTRGEGVVSTRWLMVSGCDHLAKSLVDHPRVLSHARSRMETVARRRALTADSNVKADHHLSASEGRDTRRAPVLGALPRRSTARAMRIVSVTIGLDVLTRSARLFRLNCRNVCRIIISTAVGHQR
jgi:hypothetical protein